MINTLTTYARQYKLLSFGLATVTVAFIAQAMELDGTNLLLIAMSLAVLASLLREIVRTIRNKAYGVDVLAATALAASLALGELWVAAIVALMLTTGRALERFAMNRAKAELSELLSRAPKKAHILFGKKSTDVDVSTLIAGDTIAIRPGEIVPVDAVMVEGTTSVDESSLTGESLPVSKSVGDEILSGTVNLDGMLVARVIRAAEDSQYQQIVSLVSNASAQRSPFVRMADRYAVPFTIFAFLLGGGVWAFSGDPVRFLQVLVVATPCPLILAAPIAIVSGMSRAAKHGIIIKNGGALEKLSAAKTIAFDKTGTLTHGSLKVDDVLTYSSLTAQEILGFAAALEAHSNHVVAQAIAQKAADDLAPKVRVRDVREYAGLGLQARSGLKDILIGRRQFMDQFGITWPDQTAMHQSKTATFLAVNGRVAGAITFSDEIRSESQSTIVSLRDLGIENMFMVTGDNRRIAQKIAKQLGITHIVAHALPADKIHAIEEVPVDLRPIAFVGDGINDAPVLARADIGIALGAKGATAASESADIVILRDNIGSVSRAVSVAKRTIHIARQSILTGIGLSVVLMLVFASGKFSPLYGAFAQEIVDVIVIINALRAHHAGSGEKAIH